MDRHFNDPYYFSESRQPQFQGRGDAQLFHHGSGSIPNESHQFQPSGGRSNDQQQFQHHGGRSGESQQSFHSHQVSHSGDVLDPMGRSPYGGPNYMNVDKRGGSDYKIPQSYEYYLQQHQQQAQPPRGYLDGSPHHEYYSPSMTNSSSSDCYRQNSSSAPYKHKAGTGGSNAQGRSFNKMLLDILRERIVHPGRLAAALDANIERFDCVNLATLLFHTGKKRLILFPSFIERIASRFSELKEELRAREASNALYGMRCMNSECVEVRQLIMALAGKLTNTMTKLVAQAVGNAIYGLQTMNSDHDEIRVLLSVLAVKVSQCTELLEAQNVGNALYGMRGMNSDHVEVRELVEALTPKIASVREELNGQAVGNSLYGLQSMNSRDLEVRKLLSVLAVLVTRSWEDLKAQEVGNALYGLKRMCSSHAEVCQLVAAISPKVLKSPEILDAQAIGNSLYGLQNMTSNSSEVLYLLKVLSGKISSSSSELDGQSIGNALYGLQGMNSQHAEVRTVIVALTEKIAQSSLGLNAQELGNALYGLQNMSSDHDEVRYLLLALCRKVDMCRFELTSQEIGNALFGLQGMNSEVLEVRRLVVALTMKVGSSKAFMESQGIGNALFGMQLLSTEHYEIRQLVDVMTFKIEQSWKMMSAQQLSHSFFGIQNLSSSSEEVRKLLIALAGKLSSCKDVMSAKQLCNAIFGLKSMFSDHAEVRQIIGMLADRLSVCMEGLSPAMFAFAMSGLQGINSSQSVENIKRSNSSTSTTSQGSIDSMGLTKPKCEDGCPEVQLLLQALLDHLDVQTQSFESSSQKFTAEHIANILFGMQRMSTECPAVVNILAVLLPSIQNLQDVDVHSHHVGNAVYGLQHCSGKNPMVHKILCCFIGHLTRLVSTFQSTLHENSNFGPGQRTKQESCYFNMLNIFQSVTLAIFRISDVESIIYSAYHCQLQLLKELVYKNYDMFHSQLLPHEVMVMNCIQTVLATEQYSILSVIANELLCGFQTAIIIRCTNDSGSTTQVLNIEVNGPDFYCSPRKQLFVKNRKAFLEGQEIVTDKLNASASEKKKIPMEVRILEHFDVEGKSFASLCHLLKENAKDLFGSVLPPGSDLLTQAPGPSSSDSLGGPQQRGGHIPPLTGSQQKHPMSITTDGMNRAARAQFEGQRSSPRGYEAQRVGGQLSPHAAGGVNVNAFSQPPQSQPRNSSASHGHPSYSQTGPAGSHSGFAPAPAQSVQHQSWYSSKYEASSIQSGRTSAPGGSMSVEGGYMSNTSSSSRNPGYNMTSSNSAGILNSTNYSSNVPSSSSVYESSSVIAPGCQGSGFDNQISKTGSNNTGSVGLMGYNDAFAQSSTMYLPGSYDEPELDVGGCDIILKSNSTDFLKGSSSDCFNADSDVARGILFANEIKPTLSSGGSNIDYMKRAFPMDDDATPSIVSSSKAMNYNSPHEWVKGMPTLVYSEDNNNMSFSPTLAAASSPPGFAPPGLSMPVDNDDVLGEDKDKVVANGSTSLHPNGDPIFDSVSSYLDDGNKLDCKPTSHQLFDHKGQGSDKLTPSLLLVASHSSRSHDDVTVSTLSNTSQCNYNNSSKEVEIEDDQDEIDLLQTQLEKIRLQEKLLQLKVQSKKKKSEATARSSDSLSSSDAKQSYSVN